VLTDRDAKGSSARLTRVLAALALLAAGMTLWVVHDLAYPSLHDLRDFDGHEIARLETAMWRSYYGHHRFLLFAQLTELLRRQFHLPFWRACAGAYHAARAAVVFQSGRSRADYERALPDLDRYYGLIRRSSTTNFDAQRAAWLELEWWIVHRERARHAPGDLARALAQLQSEIYRLPEDRFAEHGLAREEAMKVRDTRAESGAPSESDWHRIEALLDRSWTSLQHAVAH
jgi:hypothetical protein